MQTRVALDCNLLVCFIAFISYSITIAIERNNNANYLLAGIVISLSLYIYILSWLILLVMILALFLLRIKKVKFIQVFFLFTLFILLAIPLLLMHAINIFDLEQIKLFDIFTIPKLFMWRGSEFGITNIFVNFKCFLNSLTFDGYNYNSNSVFGVLYYGLIPLVFSGLAIYISEFFNDFKNKYVNFNFVLLIGLISSSIGFFLCNRFKYI